MLAAAALGILGLITGSFLNVLVLRRGAKSIRGRSECMSCGALIHWYDNIPVISWIALRGRCRACGSAISVQYPLVEVITGVIFASIGGAPLFSISYKLVFCLIAALLIAIAVYDIKHTIIPDAWVYAFAALALAGMGPVFLAGSTSYFWPYYLAGGPLTALPLFALWLVSGGKWMGLGDAKVALGMGWLLGPIYGIAALFLAFMIGAVVSLPLLLFSSGRGRGFLRMFTHTAASSKLVRGVTMKSEIPF
ncbi:MAG: prepilin peptidase, partial [Patescibacteria group bacterium]|nr:prepilin peptidase [Patescibacteria group bacterium]